MLFFDMDTDVLIEKIRRNAEAIRAAGVTGLYAFGSRVRGDAKAGSDLDAFVDFDASKKFSLLDLIKVQQILERELGIAVDLTTRNSLNPAVRRTIEAEAVRIF